MTSDQNDKFQERVERKISPLTDQTILIVLDSDDDDEQLNSVKLERDRRQKSMRPTSQTAHRAKMFNRRKFPTASPSIHLSTKNLPIDEPNSNNHLMSTDTILSRISFDNVNDILTVSRMGSIFYCLEDLYSKVFSTLCSFDEFNDFIAKPELISTIQVTLSEKIAIEQQQIINQRFHGSRYRLLSINSSDYFLKLKQLLINCFHSDENDKQNREQRIAKIIDEMKNCKRTATPVHYKDKVSQSAIINTETSTDDDDDDGEIHKKSLKIVTRKNKINETLAPTQFGIFIQCNGPMSCNIYSSNETVTSSTTTNAELSTVNAVKTESDLNGKSTVLKTSNDVKNDSRLHFEQYTHSYSKPNSLSSLKTTRSDTTNPNESQSTSIKPSPSLNMPIKRRILSTYNTETVVQTSQLPPNIQTKPSSRCIHRSKSFVSSRSSKRNPIRRRSASLPARLVHSLIRPLKLSKFLPIKNTAVYPMKSKAEPIDLTDETLSMPTIVEVEENVGLAQQRKQMKNLETRLSNPKSASHSALTRPNSTSTNRNEPVAQTLPQSGYRTHPYYAYQSDAYNDRDRFQNVSANPSASVPNAYSKSVTPNMNSHVYPYPYSSTASYPTMKNMREQPVPQGYEKRSPYSMAIPNAGRSMAPNHNLPATGVMPIVRKPNYYHTLTPEQQASIKTQPSTPGSSPCRLPCCYSSSMASHVSPSTQHQQQHQYHQSSSNHSIHGKPYSQELMIYRQHPNVPSGIKREFSQTLDVSSSQENTSRKYSRLESGPVASSAYSSYPAGKAYFVAPPPPTALQQPMSTQAANVPPSSSPWPSASSWVCSHPAVKPSVRYPYPATATPSSSSSSSSSSPAAATVNGSTRKTELYPQPRRPTPVPSRPGAVTPFVPQPSSTLISPPNTPNELTVPTVRTRSTDLQRAIIEHGYCDVDKIPKLLIQHVKNYPSRTVETMGQLFPTWFAEPDYRCIHCFRCDQVFTPQQFMTHVDDEHMQTEQAISMTSIQLLNSEKMSEHKVGLWNQFCTNLTIYAREGRIGGFSTNRNV